MFVFSGKCLLCATGAATGFRDIAGKPLSTGDIVAIWSGDTMLCDPILTAVVSDQFTSYSDGSHRLNDSPDHYVMGIRTVPMAEPGYWRVFKLKDHADVIGGEHWSAWGFSYGEDEAADALLAERANGGVR